MKRPLLLMLALVILAGCAGQSPQYPGRNLEEASRVNTQLGVSYMQQGNLNLAMESLEKAVEQDRSNAQAHAVLGVLHERLGQYDRAESSFRRSLRLDRDDSSVHNNFGRFLCNRGKYREAQQQFELALEDPLYERRELPLANAGTCALREGRTAQAEEFLRRSLEAAPRFAPALLSMAELQYEKGAYLAARGYFQRLRDVMALDAEALWLGIRIEHALGNEDDVASLALRLRSDYPDSRELRDYWQLERDGNL